MCHRALVLAAALVLGAGGAVDTAQAPAPGGRRLHVPEGGDLQAAIDQAQPGDVITLAAGARYQGPFTLRARGGTGWIEIRSDAAEVSGADPSQGGVGLPGPGTRVTPQDAAFMPVLESATGAVIEAAAGAHHYALVGLELRPVAGRALTAIVEIGRGTERAASELPGDIRIERCYIHGDPARGSRRGVALNGRAVTVADSWIADFKEQGADTQAIAGWNGPGPFEIRNNYLEAAGENLLFGGGDPSLRDLVPSDIVVTGNHLAKPTAWRAGEPGYAGTKWTVKNLLELKNARRVRIEGNLLEHNWVESQAGFAVLFTVRNQDGGSPWAVVEDVTFANNVMRGVASGINVLGRDNLRPSGQARRLRIVNNLITDVGGARWGAGENDGRFLQMLDGAAEVTVEHNTVIHTGNAITADGPVHTGFVFRGNIVQHNLYGIIGSGRAPGRDSLDRFFPGATVAGNVIVGGDEGRYPPGNFYPKGLAEVGFVAPDLGDYRLTEGSPFRAAAAGRDAGADVAALGAALTGVRSGPPEARRPCDEIAARARSAVRRPAGGTMRYPGC